MNNDWTDYEKDLLCKLWSEGHSLNVISERLPGRSRNAVASRRRDLKLPPRPSPIPGFVAKESKKRKSRAKSRHVKPPMPFEKIVGPVTEPETVFKPRTSRSCSWPIGDVGKPNFRFCDNTSIDGRVYCHEHCMKAYPRYLEAINSSNIQKEMNA